MASRTTARLRMRRQDGQVLPLVALLLMVIMGMAAFAIDISGWYFDADHLQMQADAAVTAGAQQLVKDLATCTANDPKVLAQAANYADAQGASAPITSNGEQGSVSIQTTSTCNGAQGAYVDSTVTNSSPPSFFGSVFGTHPTISAHARASLEQVSEEGGSGVMPYAISESQAVFNNQMIKMQLNGGGPLQSLVCDGNTESTNATAANNQMITFQLNGCPLTGVNPGGTTCPATPLNPPTCLWEFTHVDETNGYDAGEVPRFDNGLLKGSPLLKCTSPYPVPPNNYPQYLSNGTFVAGDPRLITIFVVPNNSFTTTSHLIPVMGYAEFYVTGWDHDPCAGKLAGTTGNGIDGPGTGGGALEGYFVSIASPPGSNVVGSSTVPCNPNPNQAWTYNCTFSLTQ